MVLLIIFFKFGIGLGIIDLIKSKKGLEAHKNNKNLRNIYKNDMKVTIVFLLVYTIIFIINITS